MGRDTLEKRKVYQPFPLFPPSQNLWFRNLVDRQLIEDGEMNEEEETLDGKRA